MSRPAPAHGTRARYLRETRAGVTPCDACKQANAAFGRRHKRIRREEDLSDLTHEQIRAYHEIRASGLDVDWCIEEIAAVLHGNTGRTLRALDGATDGGWHTSHADGYEGTHVFSF